MSLTHVIEKSRIIFGPSQAPCKLNQNKKSMSGQKKEPPMTQNIKENSQPFLMEALWGAIGNSLGNISRT
jgi:hypothetical protein